MVRLFVILGAVFGLLGVALGAFGAHGLKAALERTGLEKPFDTGVRYHMYHALATLAAALIASRWPGGAAHSAGFLFAAGIVLFSGSLYVYALGGPKWLVHVTPVGGLALMAGWVALLLAVLRQRPA